MKDKIETIAHEVFEMETPLYEARHLAMALRLMGSADEMPEDAGAAVSNVADVLIASLEALQHQRESVLKLVRSVPKSEVQP
jgi:hypothetical protein